MGAGVPMHFQNNNPAMYFYHLFLRMQLNPFLQIIDGYVNPYFNAMNNMNIPNNPINFNMNNINRINNNNPNNKNPKNNNINNNNMNNTNNNNINNINNSPISSVNTGINNINNINNSPISSVNTGINNYQNPLIGGKINNYNNLNLNSNTIQRSFNNLKDVCRIDLNNNQDNLEEEITININLKDDNDSNSSYSIKAKLKDKFEDVLNKLRMKKANFERKNYSQLIFNANKDFIIENKNLYENNIKDGEIIELTKISEDNKYNIDNQILEKEEKEIIGKWFNEYKGDKILEYFAIILSLPNDQTPPNFKSILKPEEFRDFIIKKDQNLGLEVKEHEHKLIYSLTRLNWICNKCKKYYDSSKPTYFCSLCDYNMCDNCRKEGKYEEKLSFPEIIIPPDETINNKFNVSDRHEHKLAYCRHIHKIIGPTYWECNRCHIHNEKEIWSFYCTVCNLDFCLECIQE